VRETVGQARDAGLTVEAGGEALDSGGAGGLAEAIGIAVATLVLLITFTPAMMLGLAVADAGSGGARASLAAASGNSAARSAPGWHAPLRVPTAGASRLALIEAVADARASPAFYGYHVAVKRRRPPALGASVRTSVRSGAGPQA
jgi:hypothetical protein